MKALVLELVEGPTLAERIRQSPIPVEETLPILMQASQAATSECFPSKAPRSRFWRPSSANGTGEISPDGRWLAYESNASGQTEIYVRQFPNVEDGQWLISNGGGTRPLWSPDGSELFYLAPGGRLMAVAFQYQEPKSFQNNWQ